MRKPYGHCSLQSVKLEVGKTTICIACNSEYHVRMIDQNSPGNPSLYEQSVFLIVNKQIIPLVKNVTTFGRHLGNDIAFHEEYLSRYHAEIIFENGEYVLYDKKSTSGTYVNSKKIDRCVLNSGDLITLANIHIMFVNNNPKITRKATGTTQSLHQTNMTS